MLTRTKISKKGQLVDRLGKLNIRLRRLEAEKESLVSMLNKEPGTIEGVQFKATIFTVTATLFDKEKAKEFLNETQYNACLKSGKTHNTVRVTPL